MTTAIIRASILVCPLAGEITEWKRQGDAIAREEIELLHKLQALEIYSS